MKKIKQVTVNLCDYAGTYLPKYGMLEHFQTLYDTVIRLDIAHLPEQVWLGSEFCENLFLCCSARQYQEKIDLFRTKGLCVLVAVPELHQKRFEDVFAILEQLEGVEGFVVHDIGTAVTIHERFPDRRLIMGRSFDKSIREIRSTPSQICRKYEQEAPQLHKALTDPAHLALFQGLGVSGLTTDSVPYAHVTMDSCELEIQFAYPRVLLSQAAICEFSSAEGNNPLRGCCYGCFQYAKRYELAGIPVIKQGKIISYQEVRTIDQCVSGDICLVFTL